MLCIEAKKLIGEIDRVHGEKRLVKDCIKRQFFLFLSPITRVLDIKIGNQGGRCGLVVSAAAFGARGRQFKPRQRIKYYFNFHFQRFKPLNQKRDKFCIQKEFG